MIPRKQFDAYNDAVANLTNGSSRRVEAEILAWRELNPGASVAEGRDAAIEIMSGFMQNFDDAAASLAAKWYDLQAERAHYKLPGAVTVTSYSRESVEKVARYQAEKLIDGDWPGFARMCGEAAANDARLSLNKTILANAKRDRKRGVRFARITTGAETCPFCYMLSSRGAVYHSRKTAGALDRWHNNCDCKVVMGFEDDPDAEIVQRYDPKGMRDRMSEMEEQTGLSFNNQDDNRTLRGFMALHDPDWLMYGKKVEADYSHNPLKEFGDPIERGVYDISNFRKPKGSEWRDVFAHDALGKAGIKAVPRPKALGPDGKELQRVSNPDIWINGEMWEIKSPEPMGETPKPGNELDYIENAFKSAIHNFSNPYDANTKSGTVQPGEKYAGDRRLILNLRYRPAPASYERLSGKIRAEMKDRHFSEVIYVDPEGEVHYFSR